MRATAALTLFVFLAGVAQASDTPAGSAPETPDAILGGYNLPPVMPTPATHKTWSSVHNAGLAANVANRHEEALTLFRQSLDLAHNPVESAVSSEEIGIELHNLGRAVEAKESLERAATVLRTLPDGAAQMSKVDAVLADIARNSGAYPEAERLFRAALTECPGADAGCVSIQNALADLLREQGRTGEAAQLFSLILANPKLTYHQRIDALLGLADIDRTIGAWQASVGEWNQVIETAQRANDMFYQAVALRGLGATWLDAGVPARAEPLLRRSLSLMQSDPSAAPEQIAVVLKSLSDLYSSENKLAMAEENLSKAIAMARRTLGEDHPQVAEMGENLAWIFADRGEIAAARELSAHSLDVMSKTFGAESLPVAGALATRAYIEVRAKDLNAAAENYRRALQIVRSHPDNQRIELTLIQRYRDVLKALHRNQEIAALKTEAGLISNNFKAQTLR
jgi:tetratricopeptide (TPR) repeat protein